MPSMVWYYHSPSTSHPNIELKYSSIGRSHTLVYYIHPQLDILTKTSSTSQNARRTSLLGSQVDCPCALIL